MTLKGILTGFTPQEGITPQEDPTQQIGLDMKTVLVYIDSDNMTGTMLTFPTDLTFWETKNGGSPSPP